MRRPQGLRPIGEGQHRSGWPYVLKSIEPLIDGTGVLFDDFVERSFSHCPIKEPYREPWIGVFHNPPRTPTWFDWKQSPKVLFKTPLFEQSHPNLVLAICLTKYLGTFVNKELNVTTAILMHPTETPELKFTMDAFKANASKRIVQIGWWLRNIDAIYQLPEVPGFMKTRLKQAYPWVKAAEERVRKYWRMDGTRKYQGHVYEIPRVTDQDYDVLLSKNIVFYEFLDSSANNGIVECIVRNTPVVVNRHPAVVEYLGNDYPLFYDKFEDAVQLIALDKIEAAYEYLKSMDKTRFSGEWFRDELASLVKGLKV